MTKDKVQQLSFFGLKYERFLTDDVNLEKLEKEQRDYSYIAIYSYKKIDLNNFDLSKIQQTPIINLTQSLEEIFKNFSTLTRRGIRKAEAMPDLKFSIPDANVDTSFKFYKEIKIKDGTIPDLKREFQRCVFFNAYFRNKIISSISFYDNGSCLRCKHIVSSRKEMGEQSKIAAYAARKLIWEICKYGQNHGYKKIDLGGINFDDPIKRGIAEFKGSFGGTIQDVYIYRYETELFKFLKRMLNYFRMNIH